jgi:diacylglycerol kinase (ATP)
MHLTKVAVISNGKGGSNRESGLRELVGELERHSIEVVVLKTTPAPNSARELAKQAVTMGVDLVIARGGDGTAGQVAEGLLGTQLPMAVMPGGTGNLFARSFYAVPTTPMFVRMILDGSPQAVDVVSVRSPNIDHDDDQHLVLVAMGLGTLSDAISTATPRWKRIFGQLVYAVKVAAASFDPRANRTFVEMDACSCEHSVSALFALNVTPPAMTTMSRGCNASDGLVDIVVLRATNFWQLLSTTMWAAVGKPERSKHYMRYRTGRAKVTCVRPVSLNIDGDVGVTTTEFTLTVLPGAVRMILA